MFIVNRYIMTQTTVHLESTKGYSGNQCSWKIFKNIAA